MSIKRLVEQLSIKHGHYYSEEKLFEITEEPDCAYLMMGIVSREVDNVAEAVEEYRDSVDLEDWEEFHGTIAHEIHGTSEVLLDLDNELDAIYEWGQGWKDLAIRLIEENNIELSYYTNAIQSEED